MLSRYLFAHFYFTWQVNLHFYSIQKEKYFVTSKLVVPQTLFFSAKICNLNFTRGKRRSFCVDGLMTHFVRKFDFKADTFK